MSGRERFQGKVALVTGASSGIGAAIARSLAADGLQLVICARREDRLRALAAEIVGTGALPPLARVCDLRSETAIEDLFAAVRARFGGVDVLINNAGLGRKAPLLAGPVEAWREMLELNVLGLSICTLHAVADMRRRGDDGHVIHVSSMAAHRVPGGSGIYSATKFAVRSLTEGLRLELRETGSRIRVSALSPGFVQTEFAENYHDSKEEAARTYGRYPVLQPQDIAEAVRFVLYAPAHVQVHDLLVRPTEQPS